MDTHAYIHLEENIGSIVGKVHYLLDRGLAMYEAESLELFGLRRFPKRTKESILEQIIPKSPGEHFRREKEIPYYYANAMCFLSEIRALLTPKFVKELDDYKPRENKEKRRDSFVFHYYHILLDLLFDSVLLLRDYDYHVNNKDENSKYGVGKTAFQRPETIYLYLQQMFYGHGSAHAFIDREPYITISVIRQAIEVRLRSAFLIVGLHNTKDESMQPLSMSKVLEIIDKNLKDDIHFAVPLHMINRVMGWSNIFLHIGLKDYVWKIMMVLEYLKPLFIGRKSGVSMKPLALDALHKLIIDIHPGHTILFANSRPLAEILPE